MTLQDLQDYRYNFLLLTRIVKGCSRCRAELDKAGGIRFTLDEENEKLVEEEYQKYLKKVGKNGQ